MPTIPSNVAAAAASAAVEALGRVAKDLFAGKTANGGEFTRQFQQAQQKLADGIDALKEEQERLQELLREQSENAKKTAEELRAKLQESDRSVSALSSKLHLWMWVSGALNVFSIAVIIFFLLHR